MNLFPNLQIHIYGDRDIPRNRTVSNPQSQPSQQQSNTRNFMSLLQSLLRRNNDYSNYDFDDIQIVFGIDSNNNNNTTTPTLTGLRVEDLNQYTTLFIGDIETNELCSICRNQINTDEICRKINHCGHFFHQNCVDSWFVRNHSCPMCRNEISQTTA